MTSPTRLVYPSIQCSATSHGSGVQCERMATPGAVVCHLHGSAEPHARETAVIRSSLATLMRDGEHRDPWTILLGVLHDVDSVYLDLRQPIVDGEEMTLDRWDRLVQAMSAAAHHARVCVKSQAYERWVRTQEQRVQLEGETIGEVLRAVMNPLLAALPLPDDGRAALAHWFTASLRSALEDASAGDPVGARVRAPPLRQVAISVVTRDPDDDSPDGDRHDGDPDHGPPGPDLTAVRPGDTGSRAPPTGTPGETSPDAPPPRQAGTSGTSPTLRWPPGVPDPIHVAASAASPPSGVPAGTSMPAGKKAADPVQHLPVVAGSVAEDVGDYLSPSSDGSADKSPDPDPADITDAELIDDDDDDALHAAERAFLRTAGLGLRVVTHHLDLPPSSTP